LTKAQVIIHLRNIKLYTSFILLICAEGLCGQSQYESASSLLDSSLHYSRYDTDKCLSFIDSALQSSQPNEQDLIKDLSLYYRGVCENRSGNYDAALSSFEDAFSKFEFRKDTTLLADISYQTALVHRQRTEHLEFLEHINMSLQYAEAIDYQSKIGMCNNAKLIHFKERNMYQEAENCGLFALEVFKSIGDSSSMGDVYNNLGVLMTAKGQPKKALEYHQNQHTLNVKLNNIWGKGYSHSKLAAAYAKSGQISLAKQHIHDALNITRSIGTPYELSGALHKSAILYILVGDDQKALDIAKEAMHISKSYEQKSSYSDILNTIIGIYTRQQQLDSALYYTNKFIANKDSILTESIANQLNEIEIKYETEKKEAQIDKLALEDELNQSRITQQRTIILGSLIGLVVLGFQFYRLKIKNIHIKNQNGIIANALEEKEVLLKEIHHRVKNNLQIISSLLGIQSRSISDFKAKEAITEGRTRIHSMSLIHQDLYKENNLTGVEMNIYLPKLSRDLLQTYQVNNDHISLDLDIQDLKLDVETIIPIGLIVNELITNSLKYAFPNNAPGVISILLKEVDNVLLLTVSDNGIGLDASQLSKKEESFGHSLIRAFRKKLDAKVSIKSIDGTEVKLTIRNYKLIRENII